MVASAGLFATCCTRALRWVRSVASPVVFLLRLFVAFLYVQARWPANGFCASVPISPCAGLRSDLFFLCMSAYMCRFSISFSFAPHLHPYPDAISCRTSFSSCFDFTFYIVFLAVYNHKFFDLFAPSHAKVHVHILRSHCPLLPHEYQPFFVVYSSLQVAGACFDPGSRLSWIAIVC